MADDDLPLFRPKMGKATRADDGSKSLLGVLRSGVYRSGLGRSRSSRPRAPSDSSLRRAIVKVRVVKMSRRGRKAAAVHLRYIQRDGVEKDGSPGVLYGAEGPREARDFRTPVAGERHQFRFILSPEDAGELSMTDYVRTTMERVERDLGRKLDWAAVNHHDTGHAHAHIVVRGVDLAGRAVRMDRAYISHGLRRAAQEVATEELGPRPARPREPRDRVRELAVNGLDRFVETLARAGTVRREDLGQERLRVEARLGFLVELELARTTPDGGWALRPGWTEELRRKERHRQALTDIARVVRGEPTRHHVLDGPSAAAVDPIEPGAVLRGRIAAKGLSDELGGDVFAVIETVGGAGYYVPLGPRAAEEIREGDVVTFRTTTEARSTAVDRVIAREASADGVHVPLPRTERGIRPERPEDVAARLRELERAGLARAKPDGTWQLAPSLLEACKAEDRPLDRFVVERVPLPLDAQATYPGRVWLDELCGTRLALYGFGAEVRTALEARRTYLQSRGLEANAPRETLDAWEREAVGQRLSVTSSQRFEAKAHRFRGRVRQLAPEANGRTYAQISDGGRFVIVEATPATRALEGKSVTVERAADGAVRVRTLDRERDR